MTPLAINLFITLGCPFLGYIVHKEHGSIVWTILLVMCGILYGVGTMAGVV